MKLNRGKNDNSVMSFPFSKTFFHIIPVAFGLDITDAAFKFLELTPGGKGFAVRSFGERDLPSGIVREGVVRQPEELSRIIRQALKGTKMSSYVVTSIPDEEVFLSTIQLPRIEKRSELDTAIRVEAEENIPIALEEAYFDYGLLPEHSTSDAMHVLVTAVRKATVDAHIGAVRMAGLTPLAVEPESFAIARSVVPGEYNGAPVLIIEIGASRTRLIIFGAGTVLAIGSLPFSSLLLGEAVMQALNVDRGMAITLQRNVGLFEHEQYGTKVQAAIVPLFNKLIKELERYISFFNQKQAETGAPGIDSILLSGGGSYVGGIEKYLGVGLKIAVARANPLAELSAHSAKTRDLANGQALRYSVAIGLALRGVRGDVSEFFH
ncbi:MAG: type IV pilus assembly protein PilM [Candidatus Spechtbacterales bacterium]